MSTLEVLGYLGAIIVGLILGLLGGGGSILAVPILVYLLAKDPVLATAYSLFVVGITAIIGTIKKMSVGLVSYKIAIVFAIPSFITVYLTRKYLVPFIPNELFHVNSFIVTKALFIMVLFAILMIFAAFSMIRSGKRGAVMPKDDVIPQQLNIPMIIGEGIIVGLLTGLVGAGGGFLIIPALVLFTGLSMKVAVGTSLLIIAFKSLIGFLGDVSEQLIDWTFLLTFTGLAIVGILIGTYLSRYISGARLKSSFGWFVLIMGIFIMVKELLL